MENDFEKMNKTMPYTVPEGFFEEMEERLMQEVEPKKNSRGCLVGLAARVASSVAQHRQQIV